MRIAMLGKLAAKRPMVGLTHRIHGTSTALITHQRDRGECGWKRQRNKNVSVYTHDGEERKTVPFYASNIDQQAVCCRTLLGALPIVPDPPVEKQAFHEGSAIRLIPLFSLRFSIIFIPVHL